LNNPVITEEGTVTIEHPSDDPSALELLEKKNVQEKVQGCIEALESQFREIIVLRDIQEFAYDEISEMLKIPQGTVKSRLFRARDAVRDCLKKQKGNL
jgi:RNA polymerase sigma-70 factor (ECF subfamily)